MAGSATFAMSLGAKELFHTNFLAFLLESGDPQLEELQGKMRCVLGLPIVKGERSACAVWRERHSLDLIVVPLLNDVVEHGDAQLVKRRCLVVEAKLKSMPTWEQLNRYLTKKLTLHYPSPDSEKTSFTVGNEKSVNRVLLTPEGIKVHDKWTCASWGGLCDAIKGNLSDLPEGSGLRNILHDYATALAHVLSIVVATRKRMGNFLENGRYSTLVEEVTHEDLRRLRLHDLVGKVAFDEWVGKLDSELKKWLKDNPAIGGSVTPYVHFSNGRPGMGLECNWGDLILGVQVQGMQLRRYVCSKNIYNDLEKIALEEPLLSEWFSGNACCRILTGADNKPVARKSHRRIAGRDKKVQEAPSNLRAFNANKFLYTAITLQDLPLAKVHQGVLASMQLALNLQAKAKEYPLHYVDPTHNPPHRPPNE